MKIEDGTGVTGRVQLMKNDQCVFEDNLVLTAGKNWMAARLTGAGVGANYIGVGTGSTVPAAGDTKLVAEVARKAVVVPNGVAVNNTVTYETTFTETEGNGVLREAMLNTAASGGVAIARVVFPIITKTDTDLFTVRWVLTIN